AGHRRSSCRYRADRDVPLARQPPRTSRAHRRLPVSPPRVRHRVINHVHARCRAVRLADPAILAANTREACPRGHDYSARSAARTRAPIEAPRRSSATGTSLTAMGAPGARTPVTSTPAGREVVADAAVTVTTQSAARRLGAERASATTAMNLTPRPGLARAAPPATAPP